jgi:hypothetical protein
MDPISQTVDQEYQEQESDEAGHVPVVSLFVWMVLHPQGQSMLYE